MKIIRKRRQFVTFSDRNRLECAAKNSQMATHLSVCHSGVYGAVINRMHSPARHSYSLYAPSNVQMFFVSSTNLFSIEAMFSLMWSCATNTTTTSTSLMN